MEYFPPSFQTHQQSGYITSLELNGEQIYPIHSQIPPPITMAQPSRPIDTKPRLGKDEVNILEREFKKNPKPSTQTKKAFAEKMNVELPRINNWFQNRRAKRKQEKKLRESEASHVPDTSICSSPSSPNLLSQTENFSADKNQFAPENMYCLTCPPSNGYLHSPNLTEIPNSSIESFHKSPLSIEKSSPIANEGYLITNPAEYDQNSCLDSTKFSFTKLYENLPFDCAFKIDNGNLQITSQPLPNSQSSPSQLNNYSPTATSPHHTYPFNNLSLHPLTTVLNSPILQGNEAILPLSPKSCYSQTNEDCALNIFSNNVPPVENMAPDFCHHIDDSTLPVYSPNYQQETLDPLPAPSNIPFRSRPPTNLVSRRKKVQQRPAALSAQTLSNWSTTGSSTVSHVDGFHLPAKSPVGLPMRRIVSAGGNRAVVSGRVQKFGFDMPMRSPLNLGSFENFDSFMEQNSQNIYYPPSLTGLSSLSSSLAPSTPSEISSAKLDGTMSTASSTETNSNFLFNFDVPNYLLPIDETNNKISPADRTLSKSPIQNTLQSWENLSDYNDENYLFKTTHEHKCSSSQDETAYDSKINNPIVLQSLSQPSTPVFLSPFKQKFKFDHISPQYECTSYTPQLEKNCSSNDIIYRSEKPVSQVNKEQKRFQFSHTTPADYSER